MVVFEQKWLYSGEVVAFRQRCCIRVKWLYLGKSGCNGAKVVVLGQKWLHSGKRGCIRERWFYSGQSGCILEKVAVFG